MKYLLLVLSLVVFGCADPKDGKPGKDGKSIQGPTGATGAAGRDGKDAVGRTGASGHQGPRGYDGNISRLIDSGYHCSGRHNVNYGWYELNMWVYRLSTGERYMYGRSDLHGQDFPFPDSASFFGDFVETATFIFTVSEKDVVSWRYKKDNKRGRFNCGKEGKIPLHGEEESRP